MEPQKLIYAFIDSQNLNIAIKQCGWLLDFKKFRVYLKDKYKVSKAFLFIGYVPGNESLYANLQEAGYILIFKPTLEFRKGRNLHRKGNVDAELVLHTMIEYENYEKAIIVSGDGDFYCLIEYLVEKSKLQNLLIPNPKKYSAQLRKFHSYFAFISKLENKLGSQKKRE